MNRTELRETVVYRKKKDFDSTTIQGSPKSNLLIDHITVQFDLYRNNSIYEATTPLLFHDSKHPGFSHIILKDREVDNSKFLADCYHILTSSFPNGKGRKRASSWAPRKRRLRIVGQFASTQGASVHLIIPRKICISKLHILNNVRY